MLDDVEEIEDTTTDSTDDTTEEQPTETPTEQLEIPPRPPRPEWYDGYFHDIHRMAQTTETL